MSLNKTDVFLLVRIEDVPSNSEEARKMEAITRGRIKESLEATLYYHGKSEMAKRGYELDALMANNTMVAYAGVRKR